MARRKLVVKRKRYTRADGVVVKATTFKTPDKGALGRTPRSRRWYRPSVHTGWDKNMPIGERRKLVLSAHGGDALASGRAMQALSNVSADPATKKEAGVDARYFFRVHKEKSGR